MENKKTYLSGGFITISRRLLENEIWFDKPAEWLKIWLYILLHVNWKDSKLHKRGENWFKFAQIAEATNTSYNQVNKCVQFLKQATVVATHKSTRGTRIKVLNYNKYQDPDFVQSNTSSNTSSNTQATLYHNKGIIKENISSKDKIFPKKKIFDENIQKLSNFLLSCIKENNPNFKGNERNWDDAFDKMIRIDKRNYEEVVQVILFCQEDDFWKANILSGAKLREKFDQLWLTAKTKNEKMNIPRFD